MAPFCLAPTHSPQRSWALVVERNCVSNEAGNSPVPSCAEGNGGRPDLLRSHNQHFDIKFLTISNAIPHSTFGYNNYPIYSDYLINQNYTLSDLDLIRFLKFFTVTNLWTHFPMRHNSYFFYLFLLLSAVHPKLIFS